MAQDNEWYEKKYEDVTLELESSEEGLSFTEAQNRLLKFGPNKLPEAKADSLWLIFVRQFASPLIYVLLAADLIVLYLKEYTDAIIILFVLLFNAAIGTYQEGRSRNTLLALRRFVETEARVLRDGREIIIPDYEVVPGDILLLDQGDKIAADARIISSLNLKVDESALTGESEPVEKINSVLLGEKLISADQTNMLFKGTFAVSGSGHAVVVATGLTTEIGRISKKIASINTEIPLKKNIQQLSKIVTFVVLLMIVVLFIYGTSLGKTAIEMFNLSVSLAVSVIPEGLPLVVTLVLATGVFRMSRRNALVKKLQAVESLGQTKIIAVDKTGTLTKNEMTIERVFVNGKIFEIGGAGYEPKGDILFENKIINPINHPELIFAGRIATFCANANVYYLEDVKTWKVSGDPTDAAMLVLGGKLGFEKGKLEAEFPRLAEAPFDNITKIHSIMHQIDGKTIMTSVGAPETVLNASDKIWKDGKHIKLTNQEKIEIEKTFEQFSSRGYRVLAISIRESTGPKVNFSDINNLVFVGFFAMRDPLRKEARPAILAATEAGVKIVMITGDHKKTAESIARDVGIWNQGDLILTGEEINSLSPSELVRKLPKVSVFARVTPEHKIRIIQAYRERGEVIAMTGDGVNDAPSLMAADLGVSTNISEILVITLALFWALPIPLLPAQIIWLNLVTDTFLVIALSMDPKERDLLTRKFKRSKRLVDLHMVVRMIVMAVPMTLGTFFLFNGLVSVGMPGFAPATMSHTWTVILTVLAVFQWFNAWNCRHDRESIFSSNPFSNKYLNGAFVLIIGLQLLVVYNPFMQKIFHTSVLSISDWLYIIIVALSVVVFEEARKLIVRKFKFAI
ncbi:MAG: ATPase, P-type (Transporting), HAD superfamily, subfamily IC [Candidatus Nomurabacteria bacterium GW2011_GWB1_37_5]|uniref:ATPase, P-type (Transporting), HAD superfamily, subfamily IC n=1 Tax=Candidatus Nomurabacteria bacterium GW2011_GWB1_37_5 TaxID=1618742 RepID=A0A0G0JD85_9BACT|nr:MAG: ATPase, P-type (Transporting), HAD superfamily, subfamily IC [Candidatus Nomurabacteria bacterium GW2011_GWB1_37_5]